MEKMPDWISVKDRLPEEDVYIIVFKNDDSPMVTFGFLCRDSYGSHFLDKTQKLIKNVSHWRYLPDPPKENIMTENKTDSITGEQYKKIVTGILKVFEPYKKLNAKEMAAILIQQAAMCAYLSIKNNALAESEIRNLVEETIKICNEKLKQE